MRDPRIDAALAELPQGWFHHGPKILELLLDLRPQVYVELGTWRGASAIAVARLLRAWGGEVFCVDSWCGNVNGGTVQAVPGMIGECAANLVEAGVSASVRLIPSLTAPAGRVWGSRPIDVLYVDADHTEASVWADLESWTPHVRPGGLVLGDDYGNPMYPGVARAWQAWAARHRLTLEVHAPPQTDPPGMQLVWYRQPGLTQTRYRFVEGLGMQPAADGHWVPAP